MTTIGIKALKAQLGQFVSRAKAGEKILVTDRGSPVALLTAVPPELHALNEMRRKGRIRWSGKKPRGLPETVRRRWRSKTPDVAGAVVEDRER